MLKTLRFSTTLPLEKYNLYTQLSSLTVHSVTNVILSHFRNDDYKKVVHEIKNVLKDNDMTSYINSALNCPDIRVKIAAIALKYRLYWLFKIWSLH